MSEVLSIQRTYEDAQDIADGCNKFLAIPVIVMQTRLDKLLRRYRVVCNREHLEQGIVWEREHGTA